MAECNWKWDAMWWKQGAVHADDMARIADAIESCKRGWRTSSSGHSQRHSLVRSGAGSGALGNRHNNHCCLCPASVEVDENASAFAAHWAFLGMGGSLRAQLCGHCPRRCSRKAVWLSCMLTFFDG